MVTLVVALVVGALALVGGGFMGFKWGRSAQVKAQALLAAAKK